MFTMLGKTNDMEIATTQDQEQVVIPSFKDWVINVIIMAIPLIGLIMLIVWAVDSDKRNLIRKRWASATLMVYVIAFALMMILWFAFFAAFMASGKFGNMKDIETEYKIDTASWQSVDSAMNAIDTTSFNMEADTAQ